jgi:hypothetical protein
LTIPVTKTLARNIVYGAIALVAFLGTSGLIHALLPPMIPKGVAAKLEFFSAHKNEFDTLFVGTSHFYYGVSPKIFDETTRAAGLPTRTFNFGIDGMHPPENFYVLEQILKSRPQNLKWVFIEMGEIETKLKENELGTERLLYWHDWRRTLVAIRKTLNPRDGLKWYDNVSRIWTARRVLALHLGLFAKRFANVGRAADWSRTSNNDGAKLELGPAGDGYRIAGSAMLPERAAIFQETLAGELRNAGPRTVDRYTDTAYREAATRVRELRSTPIFVSTPVIFQSVLQFRTAPPPGVVLSFNDARAYPAFYDSAVRIDDGHLTKEGAEGFTRVLAEQFVRYAKQP